MPEKKPFQRLPTDVVPVNYDIRLEPNLKTFVFKGSEKIDVQVNKPTSKIVINSADIEIQAASYQAAGASDKVDAKVDFSVEDETVTFTFPADLQAGKGTLSLDFTGELNDKLKGFYRSKYEVDGEERYAAVTQFEATDARRAFPSWDEPAIKATFDITLVVPESKVALSNMPVISETKENGLKVVKYSKTPVMSTYLIAFVVGEYDYVEAKDADGVLVRVYTPVGKKTHGQFALDVAVKTLPFYKEYFKIAYPLPKIDLIAIADFSAGAMENWGLVTYRETALLVDPESSSQRSKQWIALVVGHELAHQWFGNLVTMEWWTHLWLNEGFASWIEYLCVDYCFPEFEIWTQFVDADLATALRLDALNNSHPIEVPVGHPSEVDEIFDPISYSKGASVIRMLHDYIGDDDFRKGMNAYLTKFQNKNAFTEDLWEALGAASGKPVAAMMTGWTKQMGFPVLKVSQTQEGDKRVLQISQEKFCADGKKPAGDSFQWLVPISICSASSPGKPVKSLVLDSASTTVTLENIPQGDWVKLNPGTVGVYRVQYSSEMLELLLPAIKSKVLPPTDRLGLQSDLFALARAGEISTVDVLKVSEAFTNEENYTVWSDLNKNLSQIALLIQYTDYYDDYKSFSKKLFGPLGERLGWDTKPNEGPLVAMLRELVITRLGRYGHETTVTEAKARFEAHYTGAKVLPADLRSPVYITVLSQADQETFNKFLQLFDKADSQEERDRIQRALGCVATKELQSKVLDFALSDKVRSQDTVFVIAGVTGSAQGRELAWEFVKSNWSTLHNRYKGGFLLSRLVKTTTDGFASEDKAQEVEAFFKEHPAPAAERTVQQSCENIRLNADWMARDSEKVKAFLQGK
ncbi:puromycin-sensitive aminopeptidase-like isoform X2 [Liolophura sinensis]|uniref:puromycin-sensitive aminopeptidase-like isoform X1 n=1 Tax=Liolophura sinensis TaxID=3198878 RepID=UPI00315822E3